MAVAITKQQLAEAKTLRKLQCGSTGRALPASRPHFGDGFRLCPVKLSRYEKGQVARPGAQCAAPLLDQVEKDIANTSITCLVSLAPDAQWRGRVQRQSQLLSCQGRFRTHTQLPTPWRATRAVNGTVLLCECASEVEPSTSSVLLAGRRVQRLHPAPVFCPQKP